MAVDVSGLLPEPSGYTELLEQLKVRVRTLQVRAARAANSELLLQLYWAVGRDILERQEQPGRGSRVIDRLAQDLRDPSLATLRVTAHRNEPRSRQGGHC